MVAVLTAGAAHHAGHDAVLKELDELGQHHAADHQDDYTKDDTSTNRRTIIPRTIHLQEDDYTKDDTSTGERLYQGRYIYRRTTIPRTIHLKTGTLLEGRKKDME